MRLNDFFTAGTARNAGFIERRGEGNPQITALEYDSRKIKPGGLYFALPGIHADGHAFIAAALAQGAAAVIHQRPLEECSGFPFPAAGAASREKPAEGPVFIRVRDSRFAMSPVAAAFHDFPAGKLVLAGVTGTEGKSTTVYLIWQLLRRAGKKAGFISTVQYSSGGEEEWNPEHQTTPEAVAIQARLAEMARNGAEYAVIEASSHGLSPRTNRLGDAAFDAAVLTNVTHEHLEFHGTWERYRDDKANLFRSLDIRAAERNPAGRPPPFGVINAADKSAPYFAAAAKQKILSFSAAIPPDETTANDEARIREARARADLRLLSLESGPGGNRYEVLIAATGEKAVVEDRLPGAFNAGNVLAALLTVSGLLERPVEELIPLVPSLKPVKGRMTAVRRGQPFEVLVDYAHTPSSFRTIFPPLRSRLDKTGGRIISLFGSAGERDTQKRPEQGAVAAAYSEIVILTDEDPRGEDPMALLEEIAAGCEAPGESETARSGGGGGESGGGERSLGSETAQTRTRKTRRGENLFLIPDRPRAIREALSLAKPGDLVLLLGKGHENSIIYRDHTMKYDEIAEAEKALGELGYG
ncbi:MAG: UDP-N-acetylmuramyl-tripeptide synthetase [Treponema sp.]|jgi:UDP-N-acetylmuramoyl-L-alanyl-D-glutamate--2,6-diaminopimelate ligase|nr:UDP-N-acetylmuramyl-tripeptide synthetase [Treponema sp.]